MTSDLEAALEKALDQRDAAATELAAVRRLGREQVDRLQARVQELRRRLGDDETPGSYELLRSAVIYFAEKTRTYRLKDPPKWYVDARARFPELAAAADGGE